MQGQRNKSLVDLLSPYKQRVESDLDSWLIEPGTPAELAEAMRYCTLAGGKRLRPALVYLAAEAVSAGTDDESVRRSAVAVELVHCYSLVHDDLPAMDDDTLRRGQPTAHVKFGEAMAILAGDALLTRAFSVLAEAGEVSFRLVSELARGAGPAGMIAGQVADMGLCEAGEGIEAMSYIHTRKTAALIKAAVRMGAICSRTNNKQLAAIDAYGQSLGLVFQLVDDLLDVTASAKQLGKTPGKDAQRDKCTGVALLGLKRAREMADDLTGQALGALDGLDNKAEKLRTLARLMTERTH